MTDHIELLSVVAEHLAVEILSEYTKEDYAACEGVSRLHEVAAVLQSEGWAIPFSVGEVIRNAGRQGNPPRPN